MVDYFGYLDCISSDTLPCGCERMDDLDDSYDTSIGPYEYYDAQGFRKRRTISPKKEYKIEILKKVIQKYIYSPEKKTRASSFTKDGHLYHRLKHGDEYTVRLTNNTNQYVNALLKIDSDTMGKWRISPRSSINVERPVHNSRKFVFVEENSSEAREGGVRQGSASQSNGLVEVTFIPLVDERPSYDCYRSWKPQYKNQNVLHETNSRGLSHCQIRIINRARLISRVRLISQVPLCLEKIQNRNLKKHHTTLKNSKIKELSSVLDS